MRDGLGAARVAAAAICELAGETQLARGALALEFLLLPLALPVLRALDHEIEELPRALGIGRQPVVEVVLKRAVDQSQRLG